MIVVDANLLLHAYDADSPHYTKARKWIAAHAPGKPVIETEQARVAADVVLGIGSTHSHNDGFVSPAHATAFKSWSASTDALLDSARLREMLAGLPEGVLRAKGVLWLSGDPGRRTLYQRVGRRSNFSADDWDGEPPRSSLVVIGPASLIDPQDLSRRFDACR